MAFRSTLRSDAAISGTSKQPDLLRRTAFATLVATEFLVPLRDTSLVISLEGPWGTGKTSTFNLIKKQLRKTDAIVFDFNPWMAGSAEALTEAFLIQLATAIGLADRAKEGQDAAKQLVGYSGIFTALKFIPGAEPWASLIGSVIKSVGEATASASDLKKLNLEKRKAATVSALLKLGKPIIVFIDDLDRLTPSEVFEMIRVVKAVADFPRVSYVLAFDVGHIEAALKKAGIEQAIEYLEKLVQVRLNLPAIAQTDIQALLEAEIQTLSPKILEPFHKEDPERLAYLYQTGLSALIETPRDINRIFNRLALSAETLAGEVSFPELFALEVLAVKCPPIYERIHADPDYFLKPRKPESSRFDAKPPEDPFQGMLESIHERQRPHVKKVLHELFPNISESSATEKRRRLRSLGRLAVPDRLYAAIAFGTPPGELPISEVRTFIADKTVRAQFVATRLSADTVARLFEHIDTFPDLEIDDAEDFVFNIARICDSDYAAEYNKKNENSFFGMLLSHRAWVSVQTRLDTVDNASRLAILQRLSMRDEGGRELACDAVAECYRQHTPKGSEDEYGRKRQWLTAEQSREICENWANRSLPLLFDPKLDPIMVRPVYRAARYVCPGRLPGAFKQHLESDVGLDRFAAISGKTGVMSPGGPYVNITDEELATVGDAAVLRKRAAARLKKLSSRASIELRSALMAIATGKAYFTTTGKEART